MSETLLHNTNPPDNTGGRYVVFFDAQGRAWNGTAFATYTTTRDTWDVQASQVGTTGEYYVAVPGAFPVGRYAWEWYREASVGVRSHASDVRERAGDGYWNGLRFVDGPELQTTITSVSSQTVLVFDGSAGVAPQQDDALVGYMLRVSNPTAGENGSFTSSARRIEAHTYNSGASTHTITLDAACEFTVVAGDSLEFFPCGAGPSEVSNEIVTFSLAVDNTEVIDAFVAKLGTRRDDFTRAWPVINLRPGEQTPVWVDCSAVAGGRWIRSVANAATSNAAAVEIMVDDDDAPRAAVNRDLIVIWLEAVGADGDTAEITCDATLSTGARLKVLLAVEVQGD